MNSVLRYTPFFILTLTFMSVNQWSSYPLGNTFVSWILCAALMALFIKGARLSKQNASKETVAFFNMYVWWVAICAVRGVFIADNYWDWKNLITGSFSLLICLSMPVFTNTDIVSLVLRRWIKIAFPLFLIFSQLITTDAWGFYLAPISFFLIFFPFLKSKWRWITFFVLLCLLVINLDARSTIIKFGSAFLCSILFLLPASINKWWTQRLRLAFLILPFVLGVLAFMGVFNVFNISEYAGDGIKTTVVVNGDRIESSTSADTRSFIYKEVWSSAIENGYTLWGRSLARGNNSQSFGAFFAEDLSVSGRYERYSNEVGITNIFTWTGAIGVVLYFLIFFKATHLAVYKSKNRFIPVLGVYIAFQWAFSWVENFTRFDIMNLTLWMFIAMCYSQQFRNMSNYDFVMWFRAIFSGPLIRRKSTTPIGAPIC